MESDESIDFVYSEAVNAYGSVVAKKNTKILASISKKVKMLIHHVFIHSSIFLIEVCLPVERSLRSKEWSRLLSMQSSK